MSINEDELVSGELSNKSGKACKVIFINWI